MSTRELERFIEEEVLRPLPAASALLAPYLDFFHARYGQKLEAVIFYGSCLSAATSSPTSTPDFFVVTSDGELPSHARLTRALHALVPPASQSAQLGGEERRFFKYVYLDLGQLEGLCSEAMKDLFAAGRLSKRVALVHVRDRAALERVVRALTAAVVSLVPIACALLPPSFELGDYVETGVGLSYQSEYRIEVPGKVAALIRAFPDYYQELYRRVLEVAAERRLVRREGERYQSLLTPAQRSAAIARLARSRRRGLLRWPKVLLTMDGWGEAVLQKLERKNPGLRIPGRHRRHPLVFAVPYLWRLLRDGQLRTQRR